jgi:glutamine cyclotransferase
MISVNSTKMHYKTNSLFKVLLPAALLLGLSCFYSCKEESAGTGVGFKLPEQGQTFSLGDEVKIEFNIPAGTTITSADYLLDGKKIGATTDGKPLSIKTDSLTLGYKLITAVVKAGGSTDTLTVNVEFKSPVKPSLFSYKVLNTYPHDTTSYTQGLEYHDGRFLESTGEYGESTLRWVDLETGKAQKKIDIDEKYFAEGSTLIGNQIVMLTWKENIGFVYDSKTFNQLSTFPYQNSREGWGLTYDGQKLLKSDGSNRIWFLNNKTFAEESYVDVYDNVGQVDQLNELEYIDGKLYANVYQTDKIAVIDPKNGVVLEYINLAGILPEKDKFANTDVLNGIAWDAKGKRLFVTGKKFDKLFHISLVASDKKSVAP